MIQLNSNKTCFPRFDWCMVTLLGDWNSSGTSSAKSSFRGFVKEYAAVLLESLILKQTTTFYLHAQIESVCRPQNSIFNAFNVIFHEY